MLKLLAKELKLTASILSYVFIVFALMAFLPGYPILVGTFFCCLGIFQTFQAAREANDITYTALLPVAKRDIVKAQYNFCVFIEACYFLLTAAVTLIRMTIFADAIAYTNNALMAANLVYLGFVLIIFGCFNLIFVGGFFKTAYKFGKPFVCFIIAAFLIVGMGETLFHIPGLEALGALGFEHLGTQLGALCLGIVLYIALTFVSMTKAAQDFETIDI